MHPIGTPMRDEKLRYGNRLTEDLITSSRGETGHSNPLSLYFPEPPMPSSFDKFTPGARRVLSLAQEESRRFNHQYIGTEHLLLGLVREESGVAAQALTDMGVQLEKVRSAVEFIIGRGESGFIGEPGITPRAKNVLGLAVDEARRLEHDDIGTAHLLLGLIRENDGIGAGVLASLGVRAEAARKHVLLVLKANPDVEKGDPSGDDSGGKPSALPTLSDVERLHSALAQARALDDQLEVARIEIEIARNGVRGLRLQLETLYDRLIAAERRRQVMDTEIEEILKEIEAVRARHRTAIDRVQRSLRARSKTIRAQEQTGGNVPEDSASAQD